MAEPAGGATTTAADGWGRNRLLAILASAGVVALTVAVGFIYAVYLAINSAGADHSPAAQNTLTVEQLNSDTALGAEHRDQVAARPMLAVPENAMKPTTPTTQLPEIIAVPEATNTDLERPAWCPHAVTTDQTFEATPRPAPAVGRALGLVLPVCPHSRQQRSFNGHALQFAELHTPRVRAQKCQVCDIVGVDACASPACRPHGSAEGERLFWVPGRAAVVGAVNG